MSGDNATGVILGSVLVIVATSILRNAHDKTKAGRTWAPALSGVLLLIALLTIAIFAPRFAKGLALLGLVGAFAVNGPTVFALVSSFNGSKTGK